MLTGFFRLYNVPWCNSATRLILAQESPGSSPGGTTTMSGRLDGRTRDFGSRNAGSRPAPTTTQEYGPAVQRSGRCPVTAEIVGSNPIRTAKNI